MLTISPASAKLFYTAVMLMKEHFGQECHDVLRQCPVYVRLKSLSLFIFPSSLIPSLHHTTMYVKGQGADQV